MERALPLYASREPRLALCFAAVEYCRDRHSSRVLVGCYVPLLLHQSTAAKCLAISHRNLTAWRAAVTAAAAAAALVNACTYFPRSRALVRPPPLFRIAPHRRPSRYFDSIGLECVDLDGTLPVGENTQYLLDLPMLSSICYRHVHEGLSAAARDQQAPGAEAEAEAEVGATTSHAAPEQRV